MKEISHSETFENGISVEITIFDKNRKPIKFAEKISFEDFLVSELALKNTIEFVAETLLHSKDKIVEGAKKKNLVWNDVGEDFSNKIKDLTEQLHTIRKSRELVSLTLNRVVQ